MAGTYDFAMLPESTPHIRQEEMVEALEGMLALLRPGGVLIMTDFEYVDSENPALVGDQKKVIQGQYGTFCKTAGFYADLVAQLSEIGYRGSTEDVDVSQTVPIINRRLDEYLDSAGLLAVKRKMAVNLLRKGFSVVGGATAEGGTIQYVLTTLVKPESLMDAA